ncbi:MAG TPA: cytochrome c oxidase assembly protein [Gammaproteobacteria bacterium]|jgi:cytochrome c oxidase assembly factor CtaG
MTPDLSWDLQPWVIVSLAVACFGYGRGLSKLPAQRRRQIFGPWRIASFCAGIMVLVIALLSPLSSLDDQLFSAHMAQHLLLMLVAPPLLVYSRPIMAWMCALPPGARHGVAALWTRRRGLQRGAAWLMHPLVVWVAASTALWFWHLPLPYRWALQSELVHSLEHICFFVTSLMFWSLVIEPYGRRHTDYGLTLLFVASFSVQMGMLGAIITFASRPLYTDPAALLPWGFTPLADQQLAGVVMWVPVGLVHFSTMAILFLAWLKHAERRAQSVVTRLLASSGDP